MNAPRAMSPLPKAVWPTMTALVRRHNAAYPKDRGFEFVSLCGQGIESEGQESERGIGALGHSIDLVRRPVPVSNTFSRPVEGDRYGEKRPKCAD